jgi:cytochrome c5
MKAVEIVIVGLVGTLGLAGCSQSPPPAGRGDALTRALAMTPADARLAGLYAQSCKACHTAPDSGAPLAGDHDAWAPRWAKGLPALVQSSVGGLGGMPAGGQCFACQPADYEALIRFMADRPS